MVGSLSRVDVLLVGAGNIFLRVTDVIFFWSCLIDVHLIGSGLCVFFLWLISNRILWSTSPTVVLEALIWKTLRS